MAQNKNINEQLKVIYNAIGLLPKINGTYLTQRRENSQEQASKEELNRPKSYKNLDLTQVRKKLSYELKKQSYIDYKEKKHVKSIDKERRSVTESSPPIHQLQQQLKAEAQQQKLHIIKLSEFLKLRTKQVVVWNKYKNCLSKLHSKRQRTLSNRTVEQIKQKKVNYLIPEAKPVVSNKCDTLKIKVDRCDIRQVHRKESKNIQSKCNKKYSLNERLPIKRYKNKEGEILPKGEKLITQVCNQTKLNRWEYNDSKFRPHKKKLERLNDSWGMDHDEIYL